MIFCEVHYNNDNNILYNISAILFIVYTFLGLYAIFVLDLD